MRANLTLVLKHYHCRSSSDPYAEAEGFRPSPDPFRTFPGHNEPSRGSSPPPWYIADPHTPVVSGDFQVCIYAVIMLVRSIMIELTMIVLFPDPTHASGVVLLQPMQAEGRV